MPNFKKCTRYELSLKYPALADQWKFSEDNVAAFKHIVKRIADNVSEKTGLTIKVRLDKNFPEHIYLVLDDAYTRSDIATFSCMTADASSTSCFYYYIDRTGRPIVIPYITVTKCKITTNPSELLNGYIFKDEESRRRLLQHGLPLLSQTIYDRWGDDGYAYPLGFDPIRSDVLKATLGNIYNIAIKQILNNALIPYQTYLRYALPTFTDIVNTIKQTKAKLNVLQRQIEIIKESV